MTESLSHSDAYPQTSTRRPVLDTGLGFSAFAVGALVRTKVAKPRIECGARNGMRDEVVPIGTADILPLDVQYWQKAIVAYSNLGMAGAHNKIITAAAKAELAPLGFRRQGQSRLWLADRGTWLNIVEFTPSQWSVSVDLDNAAHWLWAGRGFLSLHFSLPRVAHTEFESEQQFAAALTSITKTAAQRAQQIDTRFPSFEAIAAHVIEQAHGSERMRSSWYGYYASIAAGLVGEFDLAACFLRGITDDRVTAHVQALLKVLGSPEAFRAQINKLVTAQRVALKLPPLERLPF